MNFRRLHPAICVLLSTLLYGQESTPTFRSRADLVTIPVVVTRDGKPVRGLKQEDFQLFHNGKQESVAVFEEIGDRRSLPVEAKPQLNSVQNYVTSNSQDVVIILLDLMVLDEWFSDNNIRSSIADIGKQFAASHTPVSVLILQGSGLVQVHSFTESPEDLTKSVEGFLNNKRQRLGKAVTLVERQESVLQSGVSTNYFELVRLEDSRLQLDAVTQISNAYRGIPGRKKLIWISNNFFNSPASGDVLGDVGRRNNPIPRSEILMAMFRTAESRESAWRKLSDANIAVYPLDSGEPVNPAWDERFSAQYNGGDRFGAVHGERVGRTFTAGKSQTMLEIASKTGGKSCTDLPLSCVQKVQADASEYYILGFYLPKKAKPGWHSLKVETKQSSVSVRARSGFQVVLPPMQAVGRPVPNAEALQRVSGAINASDKDRAHPVSANDEVLTALAAPVDYTSVPLRLHWNISGSGNEPRKVELLLTSPAGGISFDPGNPTVNVDVLTFVRESLNVPGNSFPESLVKKLSPQDQTRIASSGFAYRKIIPMLPGRYGVRVFVRDNTTGKIGTVSALLVVR